MNIIDARREVWIENCWDHKGPIDPATGNEVSKNEMITRACEDDGAILEDLIVTKCVHGNGDPDMAEQEFKDSVFHWWEINLQDYGEFFTEAA